MRQPVQPFTQIELFAEMRSELLRVLGDLSDEQWESQSGCPAWTVRDLARHLLADDIGFISGKRDNDTFYFPVDNWDDLVNKINAQNAAWVSSSRRMSRKLIISMLAFTGAQIDDFLTTIDLYQLAEPVGWAGTKRFGMWLQVAREYTEYWMHHQHVCEAIGLTSLKSRRYLYPLIATFVHAIPVTYDKTIAPDDTIIQLHITGEAESDWYVIREAGEWTLYGATDEPVTARISMDGDTVWRVFTKGISPTVALSRATIDGDQALGEVLFNTVAIIA